MDFSLLVHISAPSTVADDSQWRSVATKVHQFKPVTRITVATVNTESISASLIPDSIVSINNSSTSELLCIAHDASIKTSRIGGDHFVAACRSSVPAKRCNSTRRIDLDYSKRTKYNSMVERKHHSEVTSKNLGGTDRVPSSTTYRTPRPYTALRDRALVPRTSVRKRRHTATVSESECLDSSTSRVLETSFEYNCSHHEESFGSKDIEVPRDKLVNDVQGVCPSSRNEVQLIIQLDEGVSKKSWYEDQSFAEAEILMGTRKRHFTKMTLKEQLLTPSGERVDSQTSTVSPSVTEDSRRYSPPSSPLQHRSHLPGSAYRPIDLTREYRDLNELQINQYDIIHGTVSTDDVPIVRKPQSLDAVRCLPHRIMCDQEMSNLDYKWKTFIPPNLMALAEKFDLVNVFKPVYSTRRLKNVERGYWKMLVQVTDVEADEGRCSFTSSQWSDARFKMRQRLQIEANAPTPDQDAALLAAISVGKDPEVPIPWHVHSFLEFFHAISLAISQGKAGYDTRLTLKRIAENEHSVTLKLCFWSFAEVLSHTWLMMVGLSNKKLLQVPLQWCTIDSASAKESHVVITMSGQSRSSHRSARWMEFRSGISGFWGREDVLDNSNSA